MLAIIVAVIVIFIVVRLFKTGKQQGKPKQSGDTIPSNKASKTMRCPNCGSPAKINGKQWECGWCGDYGNLR